MLKYHPSLTERTSSVAQLTFSPSGRYAVWHRTGVDGRSAIAIWNLHEEPRFWSIPSRSGNPATVHALAFAPNDELCVLRAHALARVEGGSRKYSSDSSYTISHTPITAMTLAPDSGFTVQSSTPPSIGPDGMLYWISDNKLARSHARSSSATCEWLRIAVSDPSALRIAPDGRWVVTNAPNNSTLLVRSLQNPSETRELTLPVSIQNCSASELLLNMSWSSNARYLAVVVPHRLFVFDLETGERIGPLRSPHTQLLSAPAFDVDSCRLYAGGVNIDGGVYSWSVGDWRPQEAYSWPIGPIASLAIAPNGTTAAAGDQHGAVVVWDLE